MDSHTSRSLSNPLVGTTRAPLALLVLSSNPFVSIGFGAYLVVMPFVDHAFSVSFQNTHAGMGVGHTAVAVPALPSHSTSTSVLAGPGQLISLVLRLPRGQLTVWLMAAAYGVDICSGGVRPDNFKADLLLGRTTSIWLRLVVVAVLS